MTEQEWLANTSSSQMLQFLERSTRERKLALFCGACCRRLGELLIDPRSVQALNVLDRFAAGDASREELEVVELAANEAAVELGESVLALHPQGEPEAPPDGGAFVVGACARWWSVPHAPRRRDGRPRCFRWRSKGRRRGYSWSSCRSSSFSSRWSPRPRSSRWPCCNSSV